MSADWGCAGAQTGAAQGRRLGLRRGTGWGCAGAQTGATQGRRLGLRRRAGWGCAGAQTGAAHVRRLGLRRVADWGCAGAQTGAAQCSAGGGGGAPHHRLLATPPGAGLLTRRLLGPGPACARGPHHRLLAPRCRGGARRGAVQAGSPRGWLSCAWPQASRGCFPRGLQSVHGPGRMGEGPNSRPRRFLLAVPGGGGACCFECSGRRATSHGKTQAASSRSGTSAVSVWEGGGGEWGGPLVPWRCLLSAGGEGRGRHGSPGPGGQPSARGSRPSPAPLYREPDSRAGPLWGPSSPGRCRAALAGRGWP